MCRRSKLSKRCERNRKRSKRRGILCPIHGCYLHSVSQKHSVYASKVEHLQQQGVGRRTAQMMIANQSVVVLSNEWLEAFWCDSCQETTWYKIRKIDTNYHVSAVPPELWQRSIGTIDAEGNPSVGEFTRRQARMPSCKISEQFKFIS